MSKAIHRKIIFAALACTIATGYGVAGFAQSNSLKTKGKIPGKLQLLLQRKQALTTGRGLDRFPIGFWNYASLEEFGKHFTKAEVKSWAHAGFTVPTLPRYHPNNPVQVNKMHQLLKWVNANHMKAMIFPSSIYYPTRNITAKWKKKRKQAISQAKQQFASQKGFWGFSIGDEPRKEKAKSYQTWLKMSRQQMPDIPIFLNLLPYWPKALKLVGVKSWPVYLDEIAQNWHVSVLGFDYYAQTTPGPGGVNGWLKNLRLNREAGWRNATVFWAVPLSVGHWEYQVPTQKMIRWQFNTAICGGASGIRWFYYYLRSGGGNSRGAPINQFWEKTDTYQYLRNVQVTFNQRYSDLFNKLAAYKVMCYPDSYGGGTKFKPDAVIKKISLHSRDKKSGLMIGEFVDAQNRRYVMVVNLSRKTSAKATIAFRGKKTRIHDWTFHNKLRDITPAHSGADGIQVFAWLAPGQAKLFRVTSQRLEDTSVEIQKTIGIKLSKKNTN